MSKPLIQVENLSKAYRIGLKEEIPDSLVGAVTGWMKAPLRNWKRLRSLNTFQGGPQSNSKDNGTSTKSNPQSDDIIWALKDVSFDVQEGEVVGIIGRNGAGKSTLLKILSRITEPTGGRAVIRGRVSSLLEVGTGFHQELTGRENIFMNGTILGMTKREIDRKFEEIVEFSGVERFLDTPIKRYSSGMKVRLAFAVAAHLDPEILIIDEVLAVGDSQFQRKCIGKMNEVARGGRTVLFVSHSMATLSSFCKRGIVLTNGFDKTDQPISDAIAYYLRTLEHAGVSALADRSDRKGAGQIKLMELDLIGPDDVPTSDLFTGRPMAIAFKLSSSSDFLRCRFYIYDNSGHPVATFDNRPGSGLQLPLNGTTFRCEIDELFLVPGRYRLDTHIQDQNQDQDVIEGAAYFNVSGDSIRGTPLAAGWPHSPLAIPYKWSTPSDSL